MPSHQDEFENNTGVLIAVCQSEEADQRLIGHTLHCLSSCFSYEKIVIHTIDTDVMLLLVAYLSEILRINYILVYAKMVKSGVYTI